jgi:hypothetical protein
MSQPWRLELMATYLYPDEGQRLIYTPGVRRGSALTSTKGLEVFVWEDEVGGDLAEIVDLNDDPIIQPLVVDDDSRLPQFRGPDGAESLWAQIAGEDTRWRLFAENLLSDTADAIAAHVAATDPHGDRAHSDDYTDDSLDAHLLATDPHGDRAYANQQLAKGMRNLVRDFGADPEGSLDASNAIQAAIDYPTTPTYDGSGNHVDQFSYGLVGSHIELPPGQYRITRTIDCIQWGGSLNGAGTGNSPTYTAEPGAGTVIIWDGPAGEPMFRIRDSYRPTFRNIRFEGNDDHPPSAVFEYQYQSGDSQGSNGRLTLDGIHAGVYSWTTRGTDKGLVDSVLDVTGISGNNDEMVVRNCTFRSKDNHGTALRSRQHTQSVWSSFRDCLIDGWEKGIETASSWSLDNVAFNRCGTDVTLNSTAWLFVKDWQSERSGRMADVGPSARLVVNGGRHQIIDMVEQEGALIQAAPSGNGQVISFTDMVWFGLDAHTLVLSGVPTGGSFDVTINGVTLTIPYNASAATFLAAVNASALTGDIIVGNGSLSGSGSSAVRTWVLTYTGDLANKSVDIAVDESNLTGGTTPTVTVTGEVVGPEIAFGPCSTSGHILSLTGLPTGGSFNVTIDGVTLTVPHNATAAAFQALADATALSGSGDVSPNTNVKRVTISGGTLSGSTRTWTITYGGVLANVRNPKPTVDASGLTGGTSPAVAVTGNGFPVQSASGAGFSIVFDRCTGLRKDALVLGGGCSLTWATNTTGTIQWDMTNSTDGQVRYRNFFRNATAPGKQSTRTAINREVWDEPIDPIAKGNIADIPAVADVPEGFTYLALDERAVYARVGGSWELLFSAGNETIDIIGPQAEGVGATITLTDEQSLHNIPELTSDPFVFDGRTIYLTATNLGISQGAVSSDLQINAFLRYRVETAPNVWSEWATVGVGRGHPPEDFGFIGWIAGQDTVHGVVPTTVVPAIGQEIQVAVGITRINGGTTDYNVALFTYADIGALPSLRIDRLSI